MSAKLRDLDAEPPRLSPGEVLGYVVVIWDHGKWGDTWDGEIHLDVDKARAELRECSVAGYYCVFGRIVLESTHPRRVRDEPQA